MSVTVAIQKLFDRYCRFGDRLNTATVGGLSSAKFYKLLRDCSVMDKTVRWNKSTSCSFAPVC